MKKGFRISTGKTQEKQREITRKFSTESSWDIVPNLPFLLEAAPSAINSNCTFKLFKLFI